MNTNKIYDLNWLISSHDCISRLVKKTYSRVTTQLVARANSTFNLKCISKKRPVEPCTGDLKTGFNK